jgi:DNA-binding MarR family transcriptional regulator
MSDVRLANLLGAAALGIADLLQAAATRGAGADGEAAALVILGAEPGLAILALSRALGLSHPGAVRLVDRLAAAGLVERRPGADRRAVALHLTRAGLARRRAVLLDRRATLQGLLAGLSAPQHAALDGILDALLRAMTTDRWRAYALCRLCEEEGCPQGRCPVECASRACEPAPPPARAPAASARRGRR